MDFEFLLDYISSSAFIGSLVVLVITILALRFIKQYLIKKVAYTNKDEQHQNTLAGVLFSVLQYAVLIICIIVILKLNGVNITTILASLGIMATIIGLSLQDTLKDIFSGIDIYSNNFYKVGDVVKYNGQLCEVKYFNARVTKFKDLIYESTFTVCNSNINSIEKIKGKNVLTFNFEKEENYKKILKVFDKIVERIEPIHGINSAGHSNINITPEGLCIFLSYKGNPRDFYINLGKVNEIVTEEVIKAKLQVSYDDMRDISVSKK